MEKRGYKNWWLLTVNGLVAILFGCLLVFCTENLLQAIVFYFGLVLLVAGFVLALLAYRNIKRDKGSAMILVQAVLTLALGVLIMLNPTASLRIFLILVGIWAVIIGIAQLVVLLNSGSMFPQRNLFLVNSLLTIGIGVVLFFAPMKFASALAVVIGIFTILFGILMLYLSALMKSHPKEGSAAPPAESPKPGE